MADEAKRFLVECDGAIELFESMEKAKRYVEGLSTSADVHIYVVTHVATAKRIVEWGYTDPSEGERHG